MRPFMRRPFVARAVTMAMSLVVAAPLFQGCIVSLPIIGNIVIGSFDDDELEDILDELDDLYDD